MERGSGTLGVGGGFGEMNFDSERGAGSGSLVNFRCFDGIGECHSGVRGRGVVQRKGFGLVVESFVEMI